MKNNSINETYNINNENNIYQLNININDKDIQLTVNILSNALDYFYMIKMKLLDFFKKLGLNESLFNDKDKILKIFKQIYKSNKLSLYQLDDNCINLGLQYSILYEEVKHEFQLYKVKIDNIDKFNILYNQIYLLTNKLKNYNEIKDMNNEINELNISLNKKEKELINIINEKDIIIKDISNKLINQEKIIKELINQNNNKKIINKFEEMENKINNNWNEYRQEMNNIKNNIINDINVQIYKQNTMIKEFIDKYKEIKINKNINDTSNQNININIEYDNNNKDNKNKNNGSEQSLIIKKNDSKESSNEEKIILNNLLKEMNNDKSQILNHNNIQNEEKKTIESNDKIKNDISEIDNNISESDFTIEQNSDINQYINYNDKINYRFKKNPKFLKYKLDVTYTNNSWGANDIFEVFLCHKDNKEYIISPNYITNNLDIYSLIKIKLISSLQGHKNRITVVRYFINTNDYKEYLISSDYNKILIIWDISNNYKIIHKINTQYGTSIYSSLLIFPNNTNENYIITSTWNTGEDPVYSATKIFSLDTGKYIKYINNTNNDKIYYLLSWFNQQNNKYYIVQLAYKKIKINNIIEDELYAELIDKNEYYHYSGFIYTRKKIDYLCSSSSNGYINIWNLFNKKLFKFINTINCCLFHIIRWNSHYIIVADYTNKSFKVIDLYSGEIIKDFNGYHNDAVKCIKKIFHPLYGES